MNVPFGILVIVGVLFTVVESCDRTVGQFDLLGAFLSVLAAGFLVFGLIEGRSYGSWLGKTAMIALDLFSIPSFRNGNLVAMVISLGELGVLFVLPMWMQNVLGFDAFGAGLLLLALAISSFLVSAMVSGRRPGHDHLRPDRTAPAARRPRLGDRAAVDLDRSTGR